MSSFPFGKNPFPALVLSFLITASAFAARTPVVFDTDIGTDIDDTWALAQLLRSPDLDLKLVLTDTGDTHYRAAVAAKFLEAAGRSDVPRRTSRRGRVRMPVDMRAARRPSLARSRRCPA